jgi:hypothetical protein
MPDGKTRYSQGEANKMMGQGKDDAKKFKDKFYNRQANKVCHYCKLTEDEIKQFVLLPKKFIDKDGKIHDTDCSRGGKRGITLEVDRKDPCKPYNDNNCVLACYICNNAKSNIFTEDKFKPIGELFGKIISEKLKK